MSKADVAREPGEVVGGFSGTFAAMAKDCPPSLLKIQTAARLRAVQAELGMTQEKVAAFVGTSRSAWSNWVSDAQPELAPVEALSTLCTKLPEWGMNLDWLYRGRSDHLHVRAAIRLTARLRGVDPETAGPEVLAEAAAP